MLCLDPIVVQTTCEYRLETGKPRLNWRGWELKTREASGQRAQEPHFRSAAPHEVTGEAGTLADADYALTVQRDTGCFHPRGVLSPRGAGSSHSTVAVWSKPVLFGRVEQKTVA